MALPDALASSLAGIQANFRELDKRLQQAVTDVGSRFALKDTKADLPASVAYEDEANTFSHTSGQTIQGTGHGYKIHGFTTADGARLSVQTNAASSYSQIDSDRIVIHDEAAYYIQISGEGAGTGIEIGGLANTSAVVFNVLVNGEGNNSRFRMNADGIPLGSTGSGAPTLAGFLTNCGISAFVQTFLNDADAAAARTTILTGTPAARATRTAVQTIANTTDALIAFDAEDYDTASMHDTVTNNSRITVPQAGIYAITASVRWIANSTGDRRLRILKNGSSVLVQDRRNAATSPTTTEAAIGTDLSLAANDYIEVDVRQSSGGNLDIANPTLTVRWVGPTP